jgi:multisubunit Na+/H+ antiporter MnhE subunit
MLNYLTRNIRRTFYLGVLFFYFIWKIIESGWLVAWLVLKGYRGENGTIVNYKPNHQEPWHLILIFNLISMTPGSLSVDWNEKKQEIEVHLLNASDTEEFFRVTQRIERMMLKAFSHQMPSSSKGGQP